jgi:hypothetical protein
MNPVFLPINHLNRNRYAKAISVLLLFLSFSIFSQSSDVPYEFPIKFGSAEWVDFHSHIDDCQIPENILKNMSTKALLKTCLQYPFFGNLFVHNELQPAFEIMVTHFNGFKELFQRSDAAKMIMQEYIEMPGTISADAKDFFGQYRFLFLEILVSQPQILKDLSTNEKTKLLFDVVKKCSIKINNPEQYSGVLLVPSCLIIARLLNGKITSGKKELDIKVSKFAEKASIIIDPEIKNAIIESAKQYLNN